MQYGWLTRKTIKLVKTVKSSKHFLKLSTGPDWSLWPQYLMLDTPILRYYLCNICAYRIYFYCACFKNKSVLVSIVSSLCSNSFLNKEVKKISVIQIKHLTDNTWTVLLLQYIPVSRVRGSRGWAVSFKTEPGS